MENLNHCNLLTRQAEEERMQSFLYSQACGKWQDYAKLFFEDCLHNVVASFNKKAAVNFQRVLLCVSVDTALFLSVINSWNLNQGSAKNALL